MAPILARYGSVFVYTYTAVLALGALAAIFMTAKLPRASSTPAWFDALLAVLFGAVLGGRLGFVAGQWPYYQDRLQEALLFSQGGLSYWGAWLGGAAALLLWVLVTRRPFMPYAARLLPGLALVTLFGWAACWFDGCAYGRETTLGFWSADLPDEFGVFAVRYQTQLLGFFLSLAAFFGVLLVRRRMPDRPYFWFGLLLLGTAYAIPSFWRGDPAPTIGLFSLRVDILLAGLLVVLGMLGVQSARKSGPGSG